MKPKRIQLSRKKGFKLPPNTVVVSRPSRWGNPFRVGIDGTAAECVELYRANWPQDAVLLRGKNLACWCKLGEPCHADALLEIANS